MAPDQHSPPVHRRMSLEDFVAEHLDPDDESVADEADSIPEEWKDRRRKRANGEPPDFAAETAHALEWARLHARLWKPSICDVKRLSEGRAALLIRGRRGGAVTLIMERGKVHDCRKATAFAELREVVA